MNATQRLYDEIDRACQYLPGEEADRLSEALAAAKEEQGKALTMQDVMLACGELNKRERVAVQWVLDRCRPVKEEQGKVLTVQEIDALCDAYHNYVKSRYPDLWAELSAGFEAGVRAVADSGYLAPASGLTVEQVMEALDNVGRHEGWGLVTVAKGALHKALEDLAGKE